MNSPAGSRSATGVGAGISVQVKTSRRWMVESGIYYSRNGDKSPGSNQFFSDKADYAYFGVGDSKFFSNAVSLRSGQLTMNSTAGVIRITQTPPGSKLINEAAAEYSRMRFGLATALMGNGLFSFDFDPSASDNFQVDPFAILRGAGT